MEKKDIELIPGFMILTSNQQLIQQSCINYMGYSGNNDFLNKRHIHTSPLFFKKTEKTVKFIEEWLYYCQIPKCLIKNKSFHQCDQAILNILLDKYNFFGILLCHNKLDSKSYKKYIELLLQKISNDENNNDENNIENNNEK